ncbi:hypothetical protein [Streptomyces sp. CBMA29]|uniref:hypothetical protein n=1 Tax=Streptomyces sp. CBMA29 TaxID=1896314 RepID=UPI001661F6CC|nr:hypothetical protein [Streptomyces sp. CBMA29]MBD0738204.1 hypothetical protein [Streptomyces sp. CBMA29]
MNEDAAEGEGAGGGGGSARIWVGAIPALDPDSTEVILGLDLESADPAERMICLLLNRGHEGEEGVFYLLPDDLSARYERNGERLAVTVLSHHAVLEADLDDADLDATDELRTHLAGLARDPLDADRLILLRGEIVTDFVPMVRDDSAQPLLVTTTAADALRQFRPDEGETDIAVLSATLTPPPPPPPTPPPTPDRHG